VTPVNEGLRVLVLSKSTATGYQSRRIGQPMPADRAAVLFERVVGSDAPHLGPAILRTCEMSTTGWPGGPACQQITGGGYLRVMRPDVPLP
jgi:hypothetical protein